MFCFALSACGATTSKNTQPKETSLHHTFASYFDRQTTGIRQADVYYVVHDTVILDTAHEPIVKKTVTDTVFFVPAFEIVFDSVTKKPLKDSSGKYITNRTYASLEDSLVWILKPEVRLPNDSAIFAGFKKMYKN